MDKNFENYLKALYFVNNHNKTPKTKSLSNTLFDTPKEDVEKSLDREYIGRSDRQVLMLLDSLNWEFGEGIIGLTNSKSSGTTLYHWADNLLMLKKGEGKYTIEKTRINFNDDSLNYREGFAYVLSKNRIQEVSLENPVAEIYDGYAVIFPNLKEKEAQILFLNGSSQNYILASKSEHNL